MLVSFLKNCWCYINFGLEGIWIFWHFVQDCKGRKEAYRLYKGDRNRSNVVVTLLSFSVFLKLSHPSQNYIYLFDIRE